MLKKCLSVLMCLVMLCSIFGILPISVSAQEADIAEVGANAEIAETGITQDQAVQWIKDRAYEGWWQNVDGVNGCQCVDLIQAYYQYFGYERLGGNAGDYMYNHLPYGSDWYYSDTPIPGSVFVRNYDSNNYPYGHVGLVYAVEGSTMYTVETNVVSPYDGGSNSSARYRERSVWFANRFINPRFTNPFTPVDIGTDFYANIVNLSSAKSIAVSGSNVQLANSNGDDWQKWYFERQSDLSYRITNVSTGNSMDVANFGTANETNIQVVPWSNNTAQRWYFISVGNGYSLVPKCALSSCIDISGGGTSDGTNIQLYQQNASSAQIFGISILPAFNAQNLGDRFTAAIRFNATGNALTVFGTNNVAVSTYTGSDNQLWLFERKPNRSYKITNIATNKCIDVSNYGTSDGTNIQVMPSADNYAQRWFIKAVGNGFSLVPQCATNSCIDTNDCYDGRNAYLWTQNSTPAQIVELDYMLTPVTTRSYNGHNYSLYNVSIPWKEAYRFCEKQGGHLLTINTKVEQSFVESFIKSITSNDYLWLGAMDVYSEGSWNWITGELIDYSNWANEEPNNENDEDYLMLYKETGKWNDAKDIYSSAINTYSFICEFDLEVDNNSFMIEKTFEYNRHRYEVYSDCIDWQTAKRFCEQKGGHLVTISNADENATIVSNISDLSSERYWIGLTDISYESRWNWITGEASTYLNWDTGEPNNAFGIEEYAEIVVKNGKWNDTKGFLCSYLGIGFICEYDTIPILGDANGDGEVDSVDATVVQRAATRIQVPYSEEQLMCADVDGDGSLSIVDATFIQRYDSKTAVPYPVGEAK